MLVFGALHVFIAFIISSFVSIQFAAHNLYCIASAHKERWRHNDGQKYVCLCCICDVSILIRFSLSFFCHSSPLSTTIQALSFPLCCVLSREKWVLRLQRRLQWRLTAQTHYICVFAEWKKDKSDIRELCAGNIARERLLWIARETALITQWSIFSRHSITIAFAASHFSLSISASPCQCGRCLYLAFAPLSIWPSPTHYPFIHSRSLLSISHSRHYWLLMSRSALMHADIECCKMLAIWLHCL